mgnify:FL=1
MRGSIQKTKPLLRAVFRLLPALVGWSPFTDLYPAPYLIILLVNSFEVKHEFLSQDKQTCLQERNYSDHVILSHWEHIRKSYSS